jgi:hypothetical protein
MAEAAREDVMDDPGIKADLQATKADLLAAMDTLCLRLTLRWGVMLVIGLTAFVVIIKL